MKTKSIKCSELEKYLENLLNVKTFNDYCPNGLQIEGKKIISKIAFSVSCELSTIENAIDNKVDAIIVHHGLFWHHHGAKALTGVFGKKIKLLMQNNINLFAYHLPLDAHLSLGNAAFIGKLVNLTDIQPFGEYKKMPLGIKGKFSKKTNIDQLRDVISEKLDHAIIHARPENKELVKSMAIITGGANNEWIQAAREKIDVYLTGEISEYNYFDAIENNLHFLACGHYATEKGGISNLRNNISQKFQLNSAQTILINSHNPV